MAKEKPSEETKAPEAAPTAPEPSRLDALVREKIAAGLDPAIALSVAQAQIDHDAALEATNKPKPAKAG